MSVFLRINCIKTPAARMYPLQLGCNYFSLCLSLTAQWAVRLTHDDAQCYFVKNSEIEFFAISSKAKFWKSTNDKLLPRASQEKAWVEMSAVTTLSPTVGCEVLGSILMCHMVYQLWPLSLTSQCLRTTLIAQIKSILCCHLLSFLFYTLDDSIFLYLTFTVIFLSMFIL